MELKSEFLELSVDESSVWNACLNAHGLYHNTQFVLRLSPMVHQTIQEIHETGKIKTDEQLQAMSTFLHETIHWWQHIGSTSGLVLSLTFPAQTHSNLSLLHQFIQDIGPIKSVRSYAYQKEKEKTPCPSSNTIINNFIDLEFFRSLVVDPSTLRNIAQDTYFECIGHSFHITYASVLNALGSTVDPEHNFIPNPSGWGRHFKELQDKKETGYFYGSQIYLPPLGLKELYEGQARFNQLQYLYFSTNKNLTWEDVKPYLFGVYSKAFDLFLSITGFERPANLGAPEVALFLLVCDISINPGDGFPFQIQYFPSFIIDNDPGHRFDLICQFLADKGQHLKSKIINYSRQEYEEVANEICHSLTWASPIDISHEITRWSVQCNGITELMEEDKTFKFKPSNLTLRLLFARFILFSKDKLSFPQLFCWPGAVMNTKTNVELLKSIFHRNQAIFVDKAENSTIVPIIQHGKDQNNVKEAFDIFYANNILYNLTGQWIFEDGDFDLSLDWLNQDRTNEEMREFAIELFESCYGISPLSFASIKTPH